MSNKSNITKEFRVEKADKNFTEKPCCIIFNSEFQVALFNNLY